MLVIYDSLTGNVQRFMNKIGARSVRLTEGMTVKEPYILVTYTVGFGEVPESTANFLKRNYSYLKALQALIRNTVVNSLSSMNSHVRTYSFINY